MAWHWNINGGGTPTGVGIKADSVAVVVAGTAIVFTTPFSSANYVIIPICYDQAGYVGYEITLKTANGFTVTPLGNATFDYMAALIGT